MIVSFVFVDYLAKVPDRIISNFQTNGHRKTSSTSDNIANNMRGRLSV